MRTVFNHLTKGLAAALVAMTGVVVATNAAVAATPSPLSLGFDISFPQCGGALPTSVGFGVVGVNDGHPYSTNPCLARELQWATTSLSATPQFYANTDNPGPTGNPRWPANQSLPRLCYGANTVACSYDYGWNAAHGSFQSVVAAEVQRAAASPLAAATDAQWWLDVESGNSWETIRTSTGPTSASYANDDAVIEGELGYFASVGVGPVGIYSTNSQWRGLMGQTGSTFAANEVWVPGYATLAAAQVACGSPSFTGGRVAMIQYPALGLDGDYACGLLSTPTTASVSEATSATFAEQLTVAGESAPVTYAQTSGSPALVVSSTGLVTTDGPLAAGTYTATGTASTTATSTTSAASGTFAFSLLVGTITQNPPTSVSLPVAATSALAEQLAVTGSSGVVTYVQTSGAPQLLVSSSGLITAGGVLNYGTYVARGTMSDASGDKGRFYFIVRVGAVTQSGPTSATTTTGASATFTDQLTVTGSSGVVTYVQTSGAPDVVVSAGGLITTQATLPPGSYVVRGTVSDAGGDRGRFFFNLRVSPPTPIIQNPPLGAQTSAPNSASFTQQLAVTGSSGVVTYVQSSGAPDVVVSSSGLITTSGALAPGAYVVRGTTSDASGDKGVVFFDLRVAAVSPPPPPRPRAPAPVATRVVGHVSAGRTVSLRIVGKGFSGQPRIVSHPGTTALVTKDTGTTLTVSVTVRRGSPNGAYTFTIVFANGRQCRVRYNQR